MKRKEIVNVRPFNETIMAEHNFFVIKIVGSLAVDGGGGGVGGTINFMEAYLYTRSTKSVSKRSTGHVFFVLHILSSQ
jgi:hypothetical protein